MSISSFSLTASTGSILSSSSAFLIAGSLSANHNILGLTASAFPALSTASSRRTKTSRMMAERSINNHEPPKVMSSRRRDQATVAMTMSMAFSFAGYELFRTAATTAFTERFTVHRQLALATACVSPFSILLLVWYSRTLDNAASHNGSASGPRLALRRTLLITLVILGIVLLAPASCRSVVTALAFLFQSSYLNLLCSQQWSFVNSILAMDDDGNSESATQKTRNVATIMGRIAGTSCLASTLAAGAVPWLVHHQQGGVTALWIGATLLHALSWVCGDYGAYGIAQAAGWDPQQEQTLKKKRRTDVNGKEDRRSWRDTIQLFQRVPVLSVLLVENVAFAALGAVLNVRTVNAVATAIPDAVQRSAYWGKFYSVCNGLAALFQFGIVPLLPSLSIAWRWVAVVPVLAVTGEAVSQILAPTLSLLPSPSLVYLALALLTTKVMDYSVRSVAGNMVYQPLDFESRFYGKEIISVLGSRVGRTGSSLLLVLAPGGASVGLVTAAVWAWSTQALARATTQQDKEKKEDDAYKKKA